MARALNSSDQAYASELLGDDFDENLFHDSNFVINEDWPGGDLTEDAVYQIHDEGHVENEQFPNLSSDSHLVTHDRYTEWAVAETTSDSFRMPPAWTAALPLDGQADSDLRFESTAQKTQHFHHSASESPDLAINSLSNMNFSNSDTLFSGQSSSFPGIASIGHSTHVPLEAASRRSKHTSRTLPRRRSRYALQRGDQPRSADHLPLNVEPVQMSYPYRAEDPLQRWRNSPTEDEPASLSAIRRALTDITPSESPRDRSLDFLDQDTSHSRARHRARRPRSLASSAGSRDSSGSRHSATSNRSTRSAPVQAHEAGFTRTSHNRARPSRKDPDYEQRIFKCTFCCDTFKRKYDWARHEKSLHLDLEGWRCTPFGGVVALPSSPRSVCAYCNILDPGPGHIESHNHRACHGEGTGPKLFSRKDHLVQHLRLVHQLNILPLIDDWKIESPTVRSRCGFCDLNLHSWDERRDHLASHFRKGLTMDDWHGDHEFEPHVAAQVQFAIPPYSIGPESRSFVPFSATSHGCLDHLDQILSQLHDNGQAAHGMPGQPASFVASGPHPSLPLDDRKAYTEFLTSHLAKFAQDQVTKGIVPTDEMFQIQARKVMYDSEDSWNQTVVDNPEWLIAFRNRYNLH